VTSNHFDLAACDVQRLAETLGHGGTPALLRDREITAHWASVLRVADDAALAPRIDWERDQRPAPADRTKAWSRVVRDACRDAMASHVPSVHALSGNDVTFQPLLMPWTRVAHRLACRRLRNTRERTVFAALHIDAQAALCRELSQIAARAWFVAFDRLRADTSVVKAAGPYHEFITSELTSGFATLRREYPALLRLMAERTLFAAQHTATVARRLARDLDRVHTLARPAAPVALPVRFDFGQGDSHRGGQRVVIMHWEDGSAIVYKPRSMRPELLFAALVDWYNQRTTMTLAAARVLDRGRYGWMEFVAAAPCRNAREVSRYYHRGGALLALAHVFGIEDLHHENIVAVGQQPILIDLEVMLRSDVSPTYGDQPLLGLPSGDLRSSVLRTGLLPTLHHTADGHGFIDGGLHVASIPDGQREWAWGAPNSDAMHRWLAPWAARARHNAPEPHGEQKAAVLRTRLLAGFREAMRLLLDRRAELLAPGGIVGRRVAQQSRLVYRATAVYAALLERAGAPMFLHRSVQRSVELDALSRPLIRSAAQPPAWPIVVAERHALEHGDVPRLWMRTDRCALRDDLRVIAPSFAAKSGVAACRHRLRGLTTTTIALQHEFARLLLVSADCHNRPVVRPHSVAGEADRIATTLLALRCGSRDDPYWMALGDARVKGRLERIDESFGLGRVGIAVFLGAWGARRSGSAAQEATRVSARILRACASMLAASPTAVSAQQLGVVTGIGGQLRALRHVSDPAARRRGIRGGIRLGLAALDQPGTPWDWYAGSAGFLIGCLAAAHTDPDVVRVTDLHAVAAGLAHAVRHALRVESHESTDLRLVGVGHGALGALIALKRLARYTGLAVDRARAGDVEACIAETAAKMRTPYEASDPSLAFGWCRGAAGLVLAGDAAAMDAVRSAPMLPRDDLCCGTLSVIDALLTIPDDRERVERAHVLARACITRAHRRLSYRATTIDDAFFPTVWNGLAGIGYVWLRLDDQTLPSLLSCE
jgi:type 2 lantibiotic biosynthesis protein LanM